MRHTAMAMDAPRYLVVTRRRAPRWLRRAAVLVLCVGAALVFSAGVLVVDGLTDRVEVSDVAIVPGSKVNLDGQPSDRLAARLDQAVLLYRQKRVHAVIVSGGVGVEGFDEAQVMKTYLARKGLPASVVLVDSAGLTTRATAINSARLMRQHGLQTAAVATQYFHVPRTTLALRQAGVVVNQTSHARFFELRDLYSIPREVAGYISYLRG